jgi:predicted RNase H-like nuclease (RuvC/YqgF family)
MYYVITLILSVLISSLITYKFFLRFENVISHSRKELDLTLCKQLKDLRSNILELTNIQIELEDKLEKLKANQDANNEIADKYIEQLHTKISELDVTLQNIVNKM